MDKYTLWLDLYKGRKVDRDIFEDYFEGNDENEYYYEVEDVCGDFATLEAYVCLKDDKVDSLEYIKERDEDNYGRASDLDDSLTTAEKKAIKDVCDLCFISPLKDFIPEIINAAVNAHAEFENYKILSGSDKWITYMNPEGKKGKFKTERLSSAVHFASMNREMLTDSNYVKEYGKCLGFKIYEPLFAILKTIDMDNLLK